jgi:hypothetical protein
MSDSSFVEEVLKAFRNTIKEIRGKLNAAIYNIPVPKSSELFKKIRKGYSFDQAEARAKIRKFEQEINELVYEIYGTTEEEREIIEESLQRK